MTAQHLESLIAFHGQRIESLSVQLRGIAPRAHGGMANADYTRTVSQIKDAALTIEKAKLALACIENDKPIDGALREFFTWDRLLEPLAHARVVAAIPNPG